MGCGGGFDTIDEGDILHSILDEYEYGLSIGWKLYVLEAGFILFTSILSIPARVSFVLIITAGQRSLSKVRSVSIVHFDRFTTMT